MSDAQKRARNKYDQEHKDEFKNYHFRLNKENDSDVIAKLESVQNKQGYIKSLILADIEKNVKGDT